MTQGEKLSLRNRLPYMENCLVRLRLALDGDNGQDMLHVAEALQRHVNTFVDAAGRLKPISASVRREP